MDSPAEKVRRAMPGTLHEIARATGYPVATVFRLLTDLRRMGWRVNAVADTSIANVGNWIDPENPVTATTVYAVDSSRTGE